VQSGSLVDFSPWVIIQNMSGTLTLVTGTKFCIRHDIGTSTIVVEIAKVHVILFFDGDFPLWVQSRSFVTSRSLGTEVLAPQSEFSVGRSGHCSTRPQGTPSKRLHRRANQVGSRAMLSKALMIMSLNDLPAPLSLFNHIWCRFFDDPARRNEPGS
jgi:hypothetical protein